MGEDRSLVDACRAAGLVCRCEFQHTEPRFRLSLDQSDSSPCLNLAVRDDGSIEPRALHVDERLPGVLFELVESTVRREPVMEIWLPCTEHHRYVAWAENGGWRLGELQAQDIANSTREAVVQVRNQGLEGSGGD